MSRKLVSVTGATGGIGRSLVARLSHDYDVRVLVRKSSDGSDLADHFGCTFVEGDLTNESSLAKLVEGCEIVFHCAAAVTRDLNAANELNVQGTKWLAECALSAGCKRLVHFSSVAVYFGGASENGRFTEEMQVSHSPKMDVYSRTKLQSEEVLREVCDNSSLEFAILRPTCVYGPAVPSWTTLPLEMIRKGIPFQFGDKDGLMDAVYVDDVAEAALLAGTDPNAANQTYNVGGKLVPTKTFLGYFSRWAGRNLKRIATFHVRNVAAIGNMIGKVFPIPGSADPKLMSLLAFCTNAKEGIDQFPSDKIRDELGHQCQVSLGDGMHRTQIWLESKGLIPRGKRTYRNVFGNYRFRPTTVFQPATEEGIQETVNSARVQGKRIRTIGSLHSYSAVPVANELCIDLSEYRGLIEISGSRVTVQAGMTLAELNDILAEHELALPSLGSITEQTVSGAIVTGTHGCSMHQGGLADSVKAVRVVTGSGEILELDALDERFYGVVESMGMCGILSTITLKCVPAFSLRSSHRVASLEEVMREFETLQQENDFLDLLWHPVLNQVELWAVNRVDQANLPNREMFTPKPQPRDWLRRGFSQWGFRRLHETWSPGIHRNVVTKQMGSWYTLREGRSDFVLAYLNFDAKSSFPLENLEVSVPMAELTGCVARLKEYFEKKQRYPVIGVRFRCQKSDSHWLSGSYERDACWIEMFHSKPAENYWRDIHEVLGPAGYRPHWGKNFHVDQQYLSNQYPRWNDFQTLRQTCDPEGLFQNEYTSRLFSQ